MQPSNQQEPMGIHDTFLWFIRAHPVGTDKLMVQTGVHFEEVAEMLDAMVADDPSSEVLLHEAKIAVRALATALKKGNATYRVEDKKEFLDALCDQIVTATGVGRDMQFPIPAALDEVNRSNWSKFVDGQPIFEPSGKIAKGPNFFKPDLSKYVK